MNKGFLVFAIILFYWGAPGIAIAWKNDKSMIRKNTESIIRAISDSDLVAVKEYMDSGVFETNKVNSNLYYFKLAHLYLNKYQGKRNKWHFVIDDPDYIFGVRVTALLYEGFDSSNGLKKAELVLYFRPSAPDKPCNLQTIYVNKDIDPFYRRTHVSD